MQRRGYLPPVEENKVTICEDSLGFDAGGALWSAYLTTESP